MYGCEHTREARHTVGKGVDSVVSSFEGAAALLSITGSDSGEVGAGSEDVASVTSATLESFGTSASYRTSIRTTRR